MTTTPTSTRRRDRHVIRRARAYIAQEFLRAGDALLMWPLPIETGRAVITYAMVGGVYDVPPTIAVRIVQTAELASAWPHIDYSTGCGMIRRCDLLVELLDADEPPADIIDAFRLWAKS